MSKNRSLLSWIGRILFYTFLVGIVGMIGWVELAQNAQRYDNSTSAIGTTSGFENPKKSFKTIFDTPSLWHDIKRYGYTALTANDGDEGKVLLDRLDELFFCLCSVGLLWSMYGIYKSESQPRTLNQLLGEYPLEDLLVMYPKETKAGFELRKNYLPTSSIEMPVHKQLHYLGEPNNQVDYNALIAGERRIFREHALYLLEGLQANDWVLGAMGRERLLLRDEENVFERAILGGKPILIYKSLLNPNIDLSKELTKDAFKVPEALFNAIKEENTEGKCVICREKNHDELILSHCKFLACKTCFLALFYIGKKETIAAEILKDRHHNAKCACCRGRIGYSAFFSLEKILQDKKRRLLHQL